jgi:hypothetical protein
MTGIMLYIGIGILVVIGLAFYFVITWRRHQKDFRGHLEPILKSYGLRFVAARWPGFFKVGPFPKLEIEVGRPQSRVGGIRGEFSEYRIVTFQDSEDQTHEVWANLEYEMFRLCSIRWRAVSAHDLPEAAKAMLED